MSGWHDVGPAVALPPGQRRCVTVGGKEVAIFNVDGAFYAIDNECSHLGTPLMDGFVKGCLLTCASHGWEYDLRTGAEQAGEQGVATWVTRVEGGVLQLQLK
jgi:nitrite reductase/ring-hydroxylating ferredoxin subunit